MFSKQFGLSPTYFSNSGKFLNTPMDQQLLVMGLCGDGQFGAVRGENGDACAKRPTSWSIKPPNGELDPIVQFCLGERHSIALTISGKIYSCGDNEHGQLGRDTREAIGVVEFRKQPRIIQTAAGQTHNLAVDEDGRLFSWGSNDSLQCGFPSNVPTVRKPTRVDEISQVVQIACGSLSSMVLLESNKVLIFGWYIGQAVNPLEIELLNTIPIRKISAGGDHFAVITSGGSLMCWGRNDYNQTSVVDQEEVRDPIVVKDMNHVIQVSCGINHTVVLTRNHQVFTFGGNSYGQLGMGRRSDPSPKPYAVKELTNKGIKSIAAGGGHTLALAPNCIFSFGLNACGQLGTGSFNNVLTPFSTNVMNAKTLFAGWDQSVIMCGEKNWTRSCRLPRTLNYEELKKLMQSGDEIEVIEYIMFVFGSLGCLNGSFTDGDCYLMKSGLNMDAVMNTFNEVSESPHATRFADTITTSLEQTRFAEIYMHLMTHKPESFVCDELRFFMIMPWFHVMLTPTDKNVDSILKPFVDCLNKAFSIHGHVLRMWMRLLETRHFNRIVQFLMNYVEFLFNKDHRNHEKFLPALNILNELSQVNKTSNRIPFEKFYLNSLSKNVDVRQDYMESYAAKHPEQFSNQGRKADGGFWSNYPFLFNAEAKVAILEADSVLRMQIAVIASQAPWAQILQIHNPDDTFLTYHIRRDNLVDDAYHNVMVTKQSDIAKPLRVHFVGEDAEDRGGVRKEFFMLLFQEILQPTYGLFTEDQESRMIWFTGVIDDLTSYEVVGFLCALAIHNFVIINLPFPLALYKKLLDQPITLEDFTELHPTEGRSLERLLEYEGEDLEEVFCLDFSVNLETLGHTQRVDLVENGSDIPVNQKNKADFVEKYIAMKMEHGINGVIKDELNAFIKGFTRVLNSDVVKFFQPRELMQLVIGNENYDWQIFKENTEYKGEYYARHPVIQTFWEVFFEFTTEQKRKFLLFLMGTDRVPIRGMQEVKMVIQPEPEELLPVAHTCFNLLDLPKITDKELMRKRLLVCLDNTSGFTLA